MAAVTINRKRVTVYGNKRVHLLDVSIAANGDTYASGMKVIDGLSVDSSTTGALGATKSGGTVTFATGGAIANAQVMVMGT